MAYYCKCGKLLLSRKYLREHIGICNPRWPRISPDDEHGEITRDEWIPMRNQIKAMKLDMPRIVKMMENANDILDDVTTLQKLATAFKECELDCSDWHDDAINELAEIAWKAMKRD